MILNCARSMAKETECVRLVHVYTMQGRAFLWLTFISTGLQVANAVLTSYELYNLAVRD